MPLPSSTLYPAPTVFPSSFVAPGESERYVEMLHDLPPYLRSDPDVQAIIYSQARELDRLEASIEQVRDELFGSTATSALSLWEAQLGLPINPGNRTIAERQAAVQVHLRSLSASAGTDWVAALTVRLGAGWRYLEYSADNPDGPPEGTVRIILPQVPDSTTFNDIERFARTITPAHLDIEVVSEGGFILDHSELDEEVFHVDA